MSSSNLPVFYAIERNDIRYIKKYISSGYDLNLVNSNNQSLVNCAIQFGCSTIFELLVIAGATTEIIDSNLNSPLHFATIEQKENVIQFLIEQNKKLNLNLLGKENLTPLHIASMNGNIGIAEILINNGAILDLQNEQNHTALHMACNFGHYSMVKLLIESGADLNISNTKINTPLHLAVNYCYPQIVDILLENEADANSTNEDGNTPLHIACGHSKIDISIVESLLKFGLNYNLLNYQNKTALHYASISGNSAIISKLIEANYLINLKDLNGNTPLHLASQYNKVENFISLLQNGSDINIKNNDNKTAFDVAIYHSHTDIVDLLIKANVDVNISNHSKNNSLIYATQNNCITIVNSLINAGVNIEYCNDFNENALFYARDYDITKTLIQAGININHQDNNGSTPLHIASSRGLIDIVTLLLQSGADNTVLSHTNKTALIIAQEKKHFNVANILNIHQQYLEVSTHLDSDFLPHSSKPKKIKI